MKISSRLGLAGLLAAGAVAVLGAVLLFATQQVRRELANNEAASDILNGVTALRYLTLEYSEGHAARPQAQWWLRNASLAKLLSSSSGLSGQGEQATLDSLDHTRRNIEALFAELVATRKDAAANVSSDPAPQELEARLTGQIINRVQDMISDALVLSNSSRLGVVVALQRANIAVATFGGAVLLMLAAIWIVMLRSVIRPLAKLRAGTVIIGAGNLDHRLAMTARDELGDLSRAFDTMVETLKGTTVSRDELEKANVILQSEIAERKRAEAELARSNQDLEQFAYVASHDLQEPLRAVSGSLELLQRRCRGQLDALADEFIGHAVDGATRMQTLIDGLLTYSRVGRSEEALQPTDCGRALNEALANLIAMIRETGAEVSGDALPVVRAIPAQLTLLFQNLVGNAIKFRRKDHPVRIHVGARPDGDMCVLSVKDNGIGINPQYFERIFLIFQRLHTRREYPGTGIGLALCKRIVEHHGGHIWIESAPGEGTTFFFTLPMQAGNEPQQSGPDPKAPGVRLDVVSLDS